VTLSFEARAYDDPVVRGLVDEVQQEYVRRYGGPDDAPVDPSEFALPRGLFLVGLLSDVAVATGAWRRLDEQTAEIKRMYVAASARRRGLARLMLAELERTAHEAGVRRIVLNTGTEQPEAVALYESSGYETAAGFGYYADAKLALFYAKQLPARDDHGSTGADATRSA
jgi:ribosomal protein S18 acetylase RimI-like enzyme